MALYTIRTMLMLGCAFALALGGPISHSSNLACNVQLTVFGHVWLVSTPWDPCRLASCTVNPPPPPPPPLFLSGDKQTDMRCCFVRERLTALLRTYIEWHVNLTYQNVSSLGKGLDQVNTACIS